MRMPFTPRDSARTNEPASRCGASHDCVSAGSWPAVISRLRARSRVEEASGPRWATVPPNTSPARLTRPHVGLMPKTPQSDEGMRIEPPPSPPKAIGTRPVATATADPVDEPPATRSVACGLRGMARFGLKPRGVIPYSVIGVCPRTMAPAARSRATHVASSFSMGASERLVPPRVGKPRSASLLLDRDGDAVEGPERLAGAPALRGCVGIAASLLVAVLHERAHAGSPGRQRAGGLQGAVGDLARRRLAIAVRGLERRRRRAPRGRRQRETGVATLARWSPRDGPVVDRDVAEERIGQRAKLADAQVRAEDLVEQTRSGRGL